MPFGNPRRTPEGTTIKDFLSDDVYEFAQTYLTRKRRILILRGPMYPSPYPRPDPFAPAMVCDDILALNEEDSTKPITIIIDSGGGHVNLGMDVYDYIMLSKAPVITIGHTIASMGVSVFIAGTKRLLLPNAQVILHLPETAFKEESLDSKDMLIRAKQLDDTKDSIVNCYIDRGATAGLKGKTRKQIHKKILEDIDRVFVLTAQEAIDYGLADRIVTQEDLFGG